MISLTTFGRDNTIRGVSTYNVASGQVRVISASAGGGYWLNDNQHTLASETWSGRLYIVDSVTGTQDTVFATALNRIDGTALSSDNHTLYLVLTALESDVWMLTMH
jgi:sugar lactone lactonase YvrE